MEYSDDESDEEDENFNLILNGNDNGKQSLLVEKVEKVENPSSSKNC